MHFFAFFIQFLFWLNNVFVINLQNEDLDRTNYDSDSDDSEIPDELKKDFIDENTEDFPRRMYDICNLILVYYFFVL